jgi:hypothetical protein
LRHPAMTNIKPLCENSPTNMMHMEWVHEQNLKPHQKRMIVRGHHEVH